MNKIDQHFRYLAPVMLILPLLLVTSACEQSAMPTVSEVEDSGTLEMSGFSAAHGDAKVNGQLAAQLAEVRRLTAPYHNQEIGEEDGWFIPLSECVEHPELGGMGYHYGNPAYLGDGLLHPLRPEVLVYEPQKNGRLRLVGVEYIVPFEAPENGVDGPVKGDQPYLFGQGFDDSPHVGPNGSWTLHVWLWRNNPAGMFTAFNPNVNCDYASE